MKLSEQMKREFERAVKARVEALLAEQVESAAQAEVERIVNGRRVPVRKSKVATYRVKYPKTTVLRRGEIKPEEAGFRMTRDSGLLVSLAWQSLGRGESFSGKASRADLTAYLRASKPEVRSELVSAALSEALRRKVLVPA